MPLKKRSTMGCEQKCFPLSTVIMDEIADRAVFIVDNNNNSNNLYSHLFSIISVTFK